MSESGWTTNPPTVLGWYWVKWKDMKPTSLWFFDESEIDTLLLQRDGKLFYGPVGTTGGRRMTWDELATEILQRMSSAERQSDVQVNLSKEPDKFTDVGPIGELRTIRGEWVMELEDDE